MEVLVSRYTYVLYIKACFTQKVLILHTLMFSTNVLLVVMSWNSLILGNEAVSHP